MRAATAARSRYIAPGGAVSGAQNELRSTRWIILRSEGNISAQHGLMFTTRAAIPVAGGVRSWSGQGQ